MIEQIGNQSPSIGPKRDAGEYAAARSIARQKEAGACCTQISRDYAMKMHALPFILLAVTLLSACAGQVGAPDTQAPASTQRAASVLCHNHLKTYYAYHPISVRFDYAAHTVTLFAGAYAGPYSSAFPPPTSIALQTYSFTDKGGNLAWREPNMVDPDYEPEYVSFNPKMMLLVFSNYDPRANLIPAHKQCQWFQGCTRIPQHAAGGYDNFYYDCSGR